MTFQETQARYYYIASFNSSFTFSANLVPESDWVTFTKVAHPHNTFTPFFVLEIYAPATSSQQHQLFFDQVFHLLHSQGLNIGLKRLFIMGNFDYSYLCPQLSSQTSLQWDFLLGRPLLQRINER
ncbi:hypothetical protein G6F61_012508 [Rhizopus arrhizus]|nr:hypothetical protein G6F61_012508 [Rhizopus arrhizus]